mmetsp:Transcript_21883/g.52914  ORF Transcript_21883/g.52914 Transcript_21883/m.52914 type:complete len:330 (-) Transcript_21883:166-1155(-)
MLEAPVHPHPRPYPPGSLRRVQADQSHRPTGADGRSLRRGDRSHHRTARRRQRPGGSSAAARRPLQYAHAPCVLRRVERRGVRRGERGGASPEELRRRHGVRHDRVVLRYHGRGVPERRVRGSVRSHRRQQEHRFEPAGGNDIRDLSFAGWWDRRGERWVQHGQLPAARDEPRGGGVLPVLGHDRAGADAGERRARVHARSRQAGVPPDPSQHAHSRRRIALQLQRGIFEGLQRAGAQIPREHEGDGEDGREEGIVAIRGSLGCRRAQYPDQWGDIRLSRDEGCPGWEVAAAVRERAHGHDHGTGRRGREYGVWPHFGRASSAAGEEEW